MKPVYKLTPDQEERWPLYCNRPPRMNWVMGQYMIWGFIDHVQMVIQKIGVYSPSYEKGSNERSKRSYLNKFKQIISKRI